MLCHHGATLSAEPWPDHIPVPSFGPRMACTRCGIIDADACKVTKSIEAARLALSPTA